jgi:polygalacturonase
MIKYSFFYILWTLLLMAFVPGIGKTTRFLVTEYGAKGDSMTLNTSFIQAAINDCAVKGGGVVVIPKGIFISGAIFLKRM